VKKRAFLAVLGLAASVASSYGQGFIVFDSYSANLGAGALATLNGIPLNSSFHADLYYALGTVSDPVNDGLSYSSSSDPAPSFTDLGVTGVAFSDGYFQGPTVIIPSYVNGPVSFEVVAFNGSSYESSTIRGRSGAFTESMIVNSASFPATLFGDNGPGMPEIVIVVPEPTTLALAGFGGLVALAAFRRKQS